MAGVASAVTQTNYSGGRIDLAGSGYIAGEDPGLVTVAGALAARRVRCIDSLTGKVVGEQASSSDGTYRFNNLNPARKYILIAFDHQLVYNAVIRDNITPAT